MHGHPNEAPLVSTFIRRDIQYEPLIIPTSLRQNVVACAYYPFPKHRPICFLNLYNPPTEHRLFKSLFDFAAELTPNYEVLLGGDFNAPNVSWGYLSTLRPGRLLQSYISQRQFTVLNTPDMPTRQGTRQQHCTTPDLTLYHGRNSSVWVHTQERLLSDHFILSISLSISSRSRKISVKNTNWDKFRSILVSPGQQSGSYETWICAIKQARTQATKIENTTAPAIRPDPHLVRLWRRRKRILRCISQQPHNQQLRERLQHLDADITTHCSTLDISNWNRVCDQINGTLHQKTAWHLLRSLLGPQPPPAPTLDKHLALQGSTDLIQALQNLYIPPALTSNYPSYSGPENPTLDSPFTLADLDLALAKNSRKSAPGEDTITYCLLRNLPEANKKQLLTYINEHWSEGTYPKEWKSSTIIMIPKPGKPPSLNNLRPISLTSCVGKTMERMVLDRFQEHLEATAFLPHTQIGFRSHVSTQDLFLLLQHTFLSPSSCQVHALVTVDVRKAFDNISHDHILASVRETECGQNLYTYIQNFLKDRTACFRIGGELSQPLSLTRGTPQGAVLSPTLFNLGMAQLARCLQQIPHLSHIFYADDLTLWCTHGSPGEVESTLQKGLDTITAFLTQAGLKPAPEKSELLLLSQTQYQRSVNHLISLYLDHQTIPRVSLCKVLGIHLHDRSNQANITPAINTCHSVTHLVRRVVQRRAGLNEKQASQLVHALALSKILYSVPYFTLTRQQLNKLSSALSTLYKASLNLPIHTSTQRLYETGLFLPLSSLLHLHRDRQLARLSGSHQGRWILEQAGLSPIDFYLHLPASPLPSNLRFALLPRRMAPGLDDGRRDAQALHHNPPFQTQTVAYTDASILDTGTAAYAIYIPKHSLPILHTCGPYSDPPSITTLELVPIIHAIISFSQLPRTSAYTVYSDSMAAIRSLQQRQIPADLREDLEMALHSLSSSSVTIRWVPGHAGIAGNELVHQLAREFHSRAPAIPWLSPPTNDEAAEYKKTLKLHYKQIRISHELLPRPHPQLSVAQTHILRKIQTNTLVTPARLYLFRYRSDPSCPNCPAPYANQEHCLLHCPVAYTTSFLPNPPPPSWSAWLASPQLEDQLALVLQAEDILGT